MAKKTASGLKKLPKKAYEKELAKLQAELVVMQEWVKHTGNRVVIVCEGRDAAGKGSAIKRITEVLNPRQVRISALPAPSEREKTQWYFQKYIAHLPAAGEIVIFDRSWYNRAGVERVMGFCTDAEYERFLRQAPIFEQMLIEDGIMLRKYWFSVSDKEQEARFRSRAADPMKRWKLSPMDPESLLRWEEYSLAKDEMMAHTDVEMSPWWVVESEDKRTARINVISHLLGSIPYTGVDPPVVEIPERPKAKGVARPPKDTQRYVPDVAAKLSEVAAQAPRRCLTSMTLGFVAADPSGKRIVGHGLVPAVDLLDEPGALRVTLDVDLGERDAFAVQLRLQAPAVAAPRRAEHGDASGLGVRDGHGTVNHPASATSSPSMV